MPRPQNRFLAVAGRALGAGGVGEGRYALADSSGRILQQGALPGDAAAPLAVIADYSLLRSSELGRYTTSGRLGLLRPDRAQGVVSIARQWARTPPTERAELCLIAELPELRLLLDARAEIVADRARMLSRVRDRVLAVSQEYAEILSDGDELVPEVLPILRDYPTPRHLRSAALVQLGYALREHMPDGRQGIVDRLFAIRDAGSPAALGPPDIAAATAEVMIPGDIDTCLQLESHLAEVDGLIYRLVSRSAGAAGGTTASTTDADAASGSRRRFSVLQHAGASDRGDGPAGEPADDPERLIATADALLKRRFTPERHPLNDYEEFLRLRQAFDGSGAPLESALAVRLETIGQLLALSAGRFQDAIRHRAACEERLSALAAPSSAPPSLEQLIADAKLAMAITDACVIDKAAGFPPLRDSIESGAAHRATPEILCEAVGLFALTIVFFGEHAHYPQALTLMRETLAGCGAAGGSCAGPARAMADIAEYFLAGGRPDTPPEDLAAARALADEHSRGTPYRPYFHYVTMLAAFLTGEVEDGLAAYAEIVNQGLWPRYNRSTGRLARLSHAILLTGHGEFGEARRELAAIRPSEDHSDSRADGVIREFVELRIDLATGEHRHVLARTRPDGPLGEERILGIHLRRYVPLTLLLHGTALWREGATDRAIACFHRATFQAASDEEWYALVAGQTPEYREWLSSLDRSQPTAGLTSQVYDALLARPLFVSRTLPALTPRQRRLLPLLAAGRSVSSIATELHITTNTMKSHLQALYRKLGVNSRDLAVLQAEAYGLFDLPPG